MLTSSSMAATISSGRCQLRYPEPDAITILSDPGVYNFETAAARCRISQMCKFGQRYCPKPSGTIFISFPCNYPLSCRIFQVCLFSQPKTTKFLKSYDLRDYLNVHLWHGTSKLQSLLFINHEPDSDVWQSPARASKRQRRHCSSTSRWMRGQAFWMIRLSLNNDIES
jgi:hypothetical protein